MVSVGDYYGLTTGLLCRWSCWRYGGLVAGIAIAIHTHAKFPKEQKDKVRDFNSSKEDVSGTGETGE